MASQLAPYGNPDALEVAPRIGRQSRRSFAKNDWLSAIFLGGTTTAPIARARFNSEVRDCLGYRRTFPCSMRMPCSPTLGCLPSVSSLGCLETLWAPVALRGIEEEQALGSVGSL